MITHDRNTPLLLSPHYTDKRFDDGPITQFGTESNHLFYNYSDRLWQHDWNRMK